MRTYYVLVRKYFKGPHLDDYGNAEVIEIQLIVAGLLQMFFATGSGLRFELFRTSFAACTGQDRHNRISLVPYALGDRKDLAQKIAADLTHRFIVTSGLSDSMWALGRPFVQGLIQRWLSATESRRFRVQYSVLEDQFWASKSQTLGALPLAYVTCSRCGERFSDDDGLLLHSHKRFLFCQGRCDECEKSGIACNLSRSTGKCSPCEQSSKVCTWSNRRQARHCGRCFWRYGYNDSHSEEDCVGQCRRCRDTNLPCHKSKYVVSGRCLYCEEAGEKCIMDE